MKLSNKNRRGYISLIVIPLLALLIMASLSIYMAVVDRPGTVELLDLNGEVRQTIQVEDAYTSDSGITYRVDGKRVRYKGNYRWTRE